MHNYHGDKRELTYLDHAAALAAPVIMKGIFKGIGWGWGATGLAKSFGRGESVFSGKLDTDGKTRADPDSRIDNAETERVKIEAKQLDEDMNKPTEYTRHSSKNGTTVPEPDDAPNLGEALIKNLNDQERLAVTFFDQLERTDNMKYFSDRLRATRIGLQVDGKLDAETASALDDFIEQTDTLLTIQKMFGANKANKYLARLVHTINKAGYKADIPKLLPWVNKLNEVNGRFQEFIDNGDLPTKLETATDDQLDKFFQVDEGRVWADYVSNPDNRLPVKEAPARSRPAKLDADKSNAEILESRVQKEPGFTQRSVDDIKLHDNITRPVRDTANEINKILKGCLGLK